MATLVSNSLTNSCLVDLIDVTLACEGASSKLVAVVTVADVDDEDRVGNSLLQIWKLNFFHTLSTRHSHFCSFWAKYLPFWPIWSHARPKSKANEVPM